MPRAERCPNPVCDGLLSDDGHERMELWGFPVFVCPEAPREGLMIVSPATVPPEVPDASS